MAKDRLAEILKVSSSSLDQKSLVSNETEKSEAIENLLNPYTQIRINLHKLKFNIDEIGQLMQDVTIRNDSEKEMDKLRKQNLSIGNFLMNQFNSLKADFPNENDYSMEARIKRTLFYGLHEHFRKLWHENEVLGLEAERVLKKNLKMQAKLVTAQDADDEELEELIKNKTTNIFVGNIIEETAKERQILRDLIDRLDQLKRLEKSIEDVHALFMRIQTLVLEQNEVIQRVEYHAQEAALYTDKGAGQLEKAETFHKKAFKKKIILIVIIVVLCLLLLLMLFI